eukprot:gene13881-14000_t
MQQRRRGKRLETRGLLAAVMQILDNNGQCKKLYIERLARVHVEADREVQCITPIGPVLKGRYDNCTVGVVIITDTGFSEYSAYNFHQLSKIVEGLAACAGQPLFLRRRLQELGLQDPAAKRLTKLGARLVREDLELEAACYKANLLCPVIHPSTLMVTKMDRNLLEVWLLLSPHSQVLHHNAKAIFSPALSGMSFQGFEIRPTELRCSRQAAPALLEATLKMSTYSLAREYVDIIFPGMAREYVDIFKVASSRAELADFVKALAGELKHNAMLRMYLNKQLPLPKVLQGASSIQDVPHGHVLVYAMAYWHPGPAFEDRDGRGFHQRSIASLSHDAKDWSVTDILRLLKNMLKHPEDKVV